MLARLSQYPNSAPLLLHLILDEHSKFNEPKQDNSKPQSETAQQAPPPRTCQSGVRQGASLLTVALLFYREKVSILPANEAPAPAKMKPETPTLKLAILRKILTPAF